MHNAVSQYIPTLPRSIVGEGTTLKTHSNFLRFLTLGVSNWFSVSVAIISCDDARSQSAVAAS